MSSIIFIFRDRNYYIIRREPIAAGLLADFLVADVGGCAKSFIAWFEDPTHDLGSSNATQYFVDEGMVTLTPEWIIDEEECIAKGNYFRMHLDLLIQLLRQWEIVYKQNPPYITIIVTDHYVSVVGSDTVPTGQQS